MRSEISALARLRLIDLSVAIEHNAPGFNISITQPVARPSPICLDAGLKI